MEFHNQRISDCETEVPFDRPDPKANLRDLDDTLRLLQQSLSNVCLIVENANHLFHTLGQSQTSVPIDSSSINEIVGQVGPFLAECSHHCDIFAKESSHRHQALERKALDLRSRCFIHNARISYLLWSLEL